MEIYYSCACHEDIGEWCISPCIPNFSISWNYTVNFIIQPFTQGIAIFKEVLPYKYFRDENNSSDRN
jgi:hypothetical protein